MYRQDAQNNLRYMQNQDNQKVHLFIVFQIKKTKYKKILIYKL